MNPNRRNPYYIERCIRGIVIKIPVYPAEIERLHNQLVSDSLEPDVNQLDMDEQIFGQPEEVD